MYVNINVKIQVLVKKKIVRATTIRLHNSGKALILLTRFNTLAIKYIDLDYVCIPIAFEAILNDVLAHSLSLQWYRMLTHSLSPVVSYTKL